MEFKKIGKLPQQFTSDNYSGICPQAVEAMLEANHGHIVAYGEDPWTEHVCDLFRELFETWCEVYFVFNGTAANSLSLASICQSYNGIICAPTAHIETDECGAPEFFSNGAKLLIGASKNGKLLPESIDEIVTRRTDIHYSKPKAVSITQATEVGTIYSIEELQTIHATTRRHQLKLHMDGARFANAVAELGCSPKEITWQCGVDVLCFGGTKNGLAVGEAVVFFNRELASEFGFRCKQAGQLASKMRFLSAPWLGLLKNNVWLKNAKHANNCTKLLEEKLLELEGVSIMFPRQANAVFASLPPFAIEELRARNWRFYTFIGAGGARFMCTWDTKEERVLALVADLKDILKNR